MTDNNKPFSKPAATSETRCRKRSNQGFTLIEVMVVVVIIGITLGFAMMSFGDFGQSRRILTAAEGTLTSFKSIRQQAMLESATYGLNVMPKGYKILRFHPQKNWQSANSPFLIKPRPFPQQAVVQFESSQQNQGPQVIFFSTGEITPFRLTFGTKKNPYLFQIIGETNGHLTLKSELAQ